MTELVVEKNEEKIFMRSRFLQASVFQGLWSFYELSEI